MFHIVNGISSLFDLRKLLQEFWTGGNGVGGIGLECLRQRRSVFFRSKGKKAFAQTGAECLSLPAAIHRKHWKNSQIQGTKLKLFNANTTTLLETLRAGADGYCGVMANFHPEMYTWLYKNQDAPEAEKVSQLLSICSLIERQLYPVNAKWSLAELRNVRIGDYSRTRNCEELTETYRQEVRNMEELVKKCRGTYCSK